MRHGHSHPANHRAVPGGRAATRHAVRAARRWEALRRTLPHTLVMVFLVGGSTLFVARHKEVELAVDGSPRTLHTFADSVAEVLDREGLELGAHDTVWPAPHMAVVDGAVIEVRQHDADPASVAGTAPPAVR